MDKKFSMIKWAKDLFPICRSITGSGTRKTLSYFEKLNPEFKRLKFKIENEILLSKKTNLKQFCSSLM
tara:strand:+ start:134 stop:337 length:204 start_codon:yes stop_codon:yes gene_type:complete